MEGKLVSKIMSRYFTNIWNAPNVLTLIRLFLIPVFVVLHALGYPMIALVVFCVASATDVLDGHLARKYNLITDFGKLMDPLADKVMVCAALIMQCISGALPLPAVLIVIVKESIMVYGSTYMLHHGIVVYANIWGKAAQFSFILALFLSFWHTEFEQSTLKLGGVTIDRIILWIAVVIAIIALIDYTRSALRTLKEVRETN